MWPFKNDTLTGISSCHDSGYSHEGGVGLLLVDLVPHIVDVGGEIVLGVVVDDVTYVCDD